MKKLIFALLLCGAVATVSAQQTRIHADQMERFSRISLSGKLNVEFIPSGKDSLSITLTDSNVDKFKWNVDKEELSMSLRPSSGGKGSAEIKLYYTQPVGAIAVSGSDVLIRDALKSSILSLNVGGGGKLTAQLECLDLDLAVSGNSAVSLTGTAKYLTVRATESSKVNCRQLASVSVQADAGSVAEVFVWAAERAVMSAGYGATIFYRGKPLVVRTSVAKIGLGASITNIGE